jgi:hypothetical protein
MSNKHKFCFIHIERNAGTSIRDALSRTLKIPHFKSFWYLGPMRGKGGQRAIDYINLLGRKRYDSYFSFAFVRNPYDRLVSWFSYDNFGTNTFEEWLDYFFKHVKLDQMAYLADEKREIAVDFIGKFENLQKDFNKVCDELSIPHIKLPVKNKSKRRPYRKYYTDGTLEFVREKLAEEIDFFDYEF